jgi:hypothetical protein
MREDAGGGVADVPHGDLALELLAQVPFVNTSCTRPMCPVLADGRARPR